MNSLPIERWAVPTLVVTSTLPDTLTCSCPATPHYLGMGGEGESNLPRYHMELTMTESGHVTCSLILGAAMNINKLFTLCNFKKVAHCGLCSWTVLELKSGCTSVVLLCTALNNSHTIYCMYLWILMSSRPSWLPLEVVFLCRQLRHHTKTHLENTAWLS